MKADTRRIRYCATTTGIDGERVIHTALLAGFRNYSEVVEGTVLAAAET